MTPKSDHGTDHGRSRGDHGTDHGRSRLCRNGWSDDHGTDHADTRFDHDHGDTYRYPVIAPCCGHVMTDHEARQLCRILLDAAQGEADAGRGFLVPVGTLPDLLPRERLTLDVTRRALGIEQRVWAQEHHRHVVVREIVGATRKRHRQAP